MATVVSEAAASKCKRSSVLDAPIILALMLAKWTKRKVQCRQCCLAS